MSALIRVLLSSESAQLHPGEWSDITVTVQNMSETVGRYQLTVEGLPASWVEVSRAELSLFPTDKDQVRVTLRPPDSTDTRPGRYDVQVQVTTQEEPLERTTAPFALEIRAKTALEVTLDPPLVRAAKAATVTVKVANRGNADLTVLLEAEDPSGGCYFTLAVPQLVVPAGQERSAQIVAHPTAPLQGRTPRTHAFTVAARPAEVPRLARQVQGQWEQVPARVPLWPFLAGAVILLAGLAALFFLVIQPRLQEQSTPLAQAPTLMPTPRPTVLNPTDVEPTQVQPTLQSTVATAVPTNEPTQTPPPTPDLEAEIRTRLDEYNTVRAQAEKTLNPTLLASVCVDPYLTRKTGLINQNKAGGVHWETTDVSFLITSLEVVNAEQLKVGVRKTETKLFFPKDATVPDDETCTGTIYSFRSCTYDILYAMLLIDGKWYVSDFVDYGNCVGQCQH